MTHAFQELNKVSFWLRDPRGSSDSLIYGRDDIKLLGALAYRSTRLLHYTVSEASCHGSFQTSF